MSFKTCNRISQFRFYVGQGSLIINFYLNVKEPMRGGLALPKTFTKSSLYILPDRMFSYLALLEIKELILSIESVPNQIVSHSLLETKFIGSGSSLRGVSSI